MNEWHIPSHPYPGIRIKEIRSTKGGTFVCFVYGWFSRDRKGTQHIEGIQIFVK